MPNVIIMTSSFFWPQPDTKSVGREGIGERGYRNHVIATPGTSTLLLLPWPKTLPNVPKHNIRTPHNHIDTTDVRRTNFPPLFFLAASAACPAFPGGTTTPTVAGVVAPSAGATAGAATPFLPSSSDDSPSGVALIRVASLLAPVSAGCASPDGYITASSPTSRPLLFAWYEMYTFQNTPAKLLTAGRLRTGTKAELIAPTMGQYHTAFLRVGTKSCVSFSLRSPTLLFSSSSVRVEN